MSPQNSQDEIQTLKERVEYLENINRLTMDALDLAGSLGDFQKNIRNLEDRSSILEETRARVLKLLPLRATAFFLIDESSSEFYLAKCTPDHFSDQVQKEVDQTIENGTFAWALREKRPVILSTKDYKGRLILHLMTTASRSRGMFVGILSGDIKDIPHVSLSLLSIVMLNSANALESLELYGMIRKINDNLEKIVAQRTEELTYRLQFENLVSHLSTTFINLSVDDIGSGIQNALEAIGRFVGADHGFVSIRTDDDTGSKEHFEWCQDRTESIIDPSSGSTMASYPFYRQCLETSQSIHISPTNTPPTLKKAGRNWQGRDLQSLILVPMMKEGAAIGALGFDSTEPRKAWTEETTYEIKIVADMLMHVLERKWSESERKELEIQLQHTHRMKGIGTLAAGVAHELNQPLMVIRTFVQMMLRNIEEDSEYYEEIMMMEKNTGRMKSIIDHLRDFSRQTPSELKPVDVNALVEDAFLLVNEQLRRSHIRVEKELGTGLPEVMGSFNQLEQVLVNLVTNAMDAIEDNRGNPASQGGDPENRSDGMLKIITRLADDAEHVEILVSDNGKGIPEAKVSRVFEPFFTTKDVGKGTGLGLSISYGIIKDHHGNIEVMQTGPAGSTFSMKLPATHSPPLPS